jgi:tRNA (guanine37-N1)-methyltransferase
MRIDVVTILPGLFEPFAELSFVGIARRKGPVDLRVHDLRDWTHDRHRTVDDTPYGGALAGPKGRDRTARVLLLSPQGSRLDQRRVEALAGDPHLVLVCGRYEGVDQRVVDLAVDEEISIGDYVLSGGEIPAMAVIEAVTRLLPGVLGNPDSTERESFEGGRLEGPQFTRPSVYRGLEVPEVLRSGNHEAIEAWRREQALEITRRRRPDLLAATLSEDER